jgi:hypothetical protein
MAQVFDPTIETTARVTLWGGPDAAKGRPMRAWRPCSCGCDERDGPMVGYVSGSNAEGYGITIVAPDEATYQRFLAVFGGEG